MKNQCISFLLLLCLLNTGLPAQSQDQYFHFMEKGEKAMESEDEAELANAELFFIAAKSTVGISPEQTGRAEEKRKEARKKFLRVVRDAKAEAEEQEKRARYQARIGEALGRAYMAMEQVGIDSNQVALYLAYVAYDTIRKSPHELDHFVKKSFGNTIYANFAHATQAHAGAILDLTFNTTGDRLFSRSRDHTAGLWGIQAGSLRLLTRLPHDGFIHSAIFSKDGRLLTAAADSTARLWTADGQLIATLRGHSDEVISGIFMENGYILTGSRDGTVRLWDERGNLLKTLQNQAAPVLHLATAPDGRRLLTATAEQLQFRTADGAPLSSLTLPGGYFYTPSFSPDGRRLLAPASDSSVRIYSVDDGSAAFLHGHTGIAYRAAFLPQDRGILTLSLDGTARLWAPAGDALAALPLAKDGVATAALSPDGKQIVLLSQNPTPTLWNIDTLESPRDTPLTGHAAPVTTAAFAPDSQTLLTGSADGTAKLWDLHGHVLMDLTGFDGPVTAVAFTLDGDYLLAAGADGSLAICQMPEVAYERLQTEPPKLSEEKKKAFEIR